MEKLRLYLDSTKISQRAFAKAIGIHYSVVSRFLNGSVKPKLETALRIERETRGRVPASSWFDEVA